MRSLLERIYEHQKEQHNEISQHKLLHIFRRIFRVCMTYTKNSGCKILSRLPTSFFLPPSCLRSRFTSFPNLSSPLATDPSSSTHWKRTNLACSRAGMQTAHADRIITGKWIQSAQNRLYVRIARLHEGFCNLLNFSRRPTAPITSAEALYSSGLFSVGWWGWVGGQRRW